MKRAAKAMLGSVGLLDPARRMKRLGERGLQAVCRSLGVTPHKAMEQRSYWEERGKAYFDEVQPILSDDDPYHQAQQEFLAELAALPWESLLEVGCGFGWHLHAIRSQHPDRRLLGTDFSWSQLARARSYLAADRILLGQADLHHLPFVDGAVDLVITSGVLVCVHERHLVGALHELRRVSRRGAIMMEYAREHMDSPTRAALMREAGWHGHTYSAWLPRAGFRLRKAFTFRAFQSLPQRMPLSFFYAEKV